MIEIEREGEGAMEERKRVMERGQDHRGSVLSFSLSVTLTGTEACCWFGWVLVCEMEKVGGQGRGGGGMMVGGEDGYGRRERGKEGEWWKILLKEEEETWKNDSWNGRTNNKRRKEHQEEEEENGPTEGERRVFLFR